MFKALFILLLVISSSIHAECVLKVRVNDVPPQYMLKDGKWTGKAVEMMEALLTEASCRAEYVKIPWKRALIELEKGRIDAMMNVSYNKQRADDYYLISPNSSITTVLLINKSIKTNISSLSDLEKLPNKIGYEPGNLFNEAFINKYSKEQNFRDVFVGLETGDMTKMLFLGRLSGELTMLENAKYALKNNSNYKENMKIHPMVISELPSFLAFSKRSVSKDRILELQAANIRAISKGLYNEVTERWK